jgi:hypothetical protein
MGCGKVSEDIILPWYPRWRYLKGTSPLIAVDTWMYHRGRGIPSSQLLFQGACRYRTLRKLQTPDGWYCLFKVAFKEPLSPIQDPITP